MASALLPVSVRVWGGLLLALLAAAAPVRAGDVYYMMIFGVEDGLNLPRKSHTFAVFARATCDGRGPLEYHTVSWLPADLEVQTFRLRPQAGRNLDLVATLNWAAREGSGVTMWGPFQIHQELYARALCQTAELDGGRVRYKAIDRGYRPDVAVDCIHAVSGIDKDPGLLVTDLARGNRASYLVLMHLRRWIIDSCTTYCWVSRALGLEDGAVTHATWKPRPVLLRYRPASCGPQ